MPVIEELIRTEQDGGISFGNYALAKKEKVDQFEYHGDLYKVKTCEEITKLERNGMFVYESVPGTAVHRFGVSDQGIEFLVEGRKDTQLTLQLEDDANYLITVDGNFVGSMKTNRSGKLSLSVELNCEAAVKVQVIKEV